MPSKSRRGKGKYSFQGKKKGRPSHLTTPAQQSAVAQVSEPTVQSKESVPVASVPSSAAKQAAFHYPQISAELRTIGILAVVMVGILVVLYFVLP